MADLVVTYSKVAEARALYAFPIPVGNAARSEAIAIGSSSAAGSLVAASDENVVEVTAGADCWIKIGTSPTAAAIASPSSGTGRKLLSGASEQFAVSVGEKVAVITA